MAEEEQRRKRKRDEEAATKAQQEQVEALTESLVAAIAPRELPEATRARCLQEAVTLLTEIASTICTPTRHTWQHELDKAGQELEMSANRVWKFASPVNKISWITKGQFYLYITVNPKSDTATGLPLVRSDMRGADTVPQMLTRLILRDLFGEGIEALRWWNNQTKEEKRWVRQVKHSEDSWKKAVAAVRNQWKSEGVTETPGKHKPKISPLGNGSVTYDDYGTDSSDEPMINRHRKKRAQEKMEASAKEKAAKEKQDAKEKQEKKKLSEEKEKQQTREQTGDTREADGNINRPRPVFNDLYPTEGLTREESDAILMFVDSRASYTHFPHVMGLMEEGRVPGHVSSAAAIDFIMARLLQPRFASSVLTNSRWLRAAETIREQHPNIPRAWALVVAANQDTLDEDLPERDTHAMGYAKRWWSEHMLD